MEIILKEDFPSLGYVGDKVKVKNGYARNFLIPRGVAVEASARSSRMLKHIVDGISAKRNKLKKEAEDLAKKLESVKLEFILKMGERGKTFGSITVRDIETSIKAQGFAIDRKQIRLSDAIKKAGEFKALVKLHSEVTVALPVKVALETTTAARKLVEGAADDAEKPKKRSRKKKSEDASGAEQAVDAGQVAEKSEDAAKEA